jgi:hypothetical protein
MSSLPPNNISINDITDYLSNIDATDIERGTLSTDRIPSLNANKITVGTFDAARIPSLNANKITAGTFDAARIPSLNASKINAGTFNAARIPNLNANKITAGTFNASRIPALNYANPRGSETSGNWFSAAYFKIRGGWYICQYNYLRDEYPNINIAGDNWGSDIDEGSLVFTKDSDASTVWIKQTGDNMVDAINMTGQHGLFCLNKALKNNIGYICCVSSEGYWDEKQDFSYKNKKKYININDTLPMIKLSNKKNQKSVIGVISNKRQDFNVTRLRHSNTYKEKAIIVNSIGEGAIWVSNFNGNLENGDYITSSDISGIGMKQDDDILHNYTVAKITMDCDFNPQYIPIEKMKNNTSNIILDENDNIIYEYEYDEQNNIKYDYEYEIKYIRLNGDIIDKLTYDMELSNNLPVYKMAFVGCTYHCG